jgi:hypothetical protein
MQQLHNSGTAAITTTLVIVNLIRCYQLYHLLSSTEEVASVVSYRFIVQSFFDAAKSNIVLHRQGRYIWNTLPFHRRANIRDSVMVQYRIRYT